MSLFDNWFLLLHRDWKYADLFVAFSCIFDDNIFFRSLELLMLLMNRENIFFKIMFNNIVSNLEDLVNHDWRFFNSF